MQIQVNVNNLILIENNELNENEYNIHNIQFVFSNEYTNNLVKVALFTSDEKTYKIIIQNNQCNIPPEVLANKGCFVLGVYAFEVKNETLIERFSPSPIKLFIEDGSYIADEDTENSEPLTPTDKEQILSILKEMQEVYTEKIEEINTAIEETNNLNIDIEKDGKVTTVTLTKKDGTEKTVQIDDGIGLQFLWQGTSLGIKREDQENYIFVNLQGATGLTPNIQIGTVVSGNTPSVTISGTPENPILNFTLVKGDTGDTGPAGPTGNGIASITKTSTVGLVDTYTITYTDGNTTTFTVTNGEDGEVTQEQFDELQGEVTEQENIINQLPQVSGSGTSITINNTINARFRKFDIYGHSVQNGEPSPENEQPILSAGDNIQLFDVTSFEEQLVTGKIINDNGVEVNDSTSQYSTYFLYLEANKPYHIKGAFQKIYYYDQNKIFKSRSASANGMDRIYTPSENEWIRFQIGTSYWNSNKGQEKLEEGTQATPWSPYGMGSITEKIVNKNIANKAGNGYIASDGTITATNVGFYTSFLLIPENVTHVYYYGSNLNSSMTNVYVNRISFYDENKEKILVNGSISASTVYQLPTGTKYIRASFLNAVEDYMLVFGTATEYVPHEEQSYSVYTQQPFRSIGAVRDCFVKKSDGWYERHKIKRLIFDGTENWQFDPSHYRFLILLSESQLSTNRSGKSNYFKIGNTETTNNCFSFSTTAVLFRVDETITSKADAKSWVATKYADGRPLYTDYILAEPLDLPCTEEQIQQLENPPSTYKTETNVLSEDEVEAYLEVSGLLDLNSLVGGA